MRITIFFLFLIIMSCSHTTNPIEKVLQSENPKIKKVVENLEAHEVQVLFTEVIPSNNGVTFKDYSFQENQKHYFYPASSVKFPIAVLALEKINTMPSINRSTSFLVEGDSLKTTISEEVKKIFAVSDNDAFNRLYDFLGRDEINKSLKEKGITARVSHKLSTNDQKPYPVHFYAKDSIILTINHDINSSIKDLELNSLEKGIGYTIGDSLVNKPMDFSKKNYLPISSLHSMMKRVMYPESFSETEQFHLSHSDRDFLLNCMKALPKEAGYTSDEYYDSYVKFFLFGDEKADMPNHVKIYNKVGYAYGYLTDCAYIVNEHTKKRYFLTATIHVNENKIYNDGVYEYEDLGIPFLAELGRQLIQ